MIARNNELTRSIMKNLSMSYPSHISSMTLESDLIKEVSLFTTKIPIGLNEFLQRHILWKTIWTADLSPILTEFIRIFNTSTLEAIMHLVVIQGEPELKSKLIAKPHLLFGRYWRTVLKFLHLLDSPETRRFFANTPITFPLEHINAFPQAFFESTIISGALIGKCIQAAVKQTNAKVWSSLYQDGELILTVLILELILNGHLNKFDHKLTDRI